MVLFDSEILHLIIEIHVSPGPRQPTGIYGIALISLNHLRLLV